MKNGNLLDAAESAGFQVLLTVDRGLEYQQNMTGRKIAVIVFHASSALRDDLLRYLQDSLALLAEIQPGEVVRVPRR
jgi:hypothetical protein